MKKLLLTVGLLNCNVVFADFEFVPVYSVVANDISTYLCSESNVFALESCVKEMNKCIDGYMSFRVNVREGARLMSAITFCRNSVIGH